LSVALVIAFAAIYLMVGLPTGDQVATAAPANATLVFGASAGVFLADAAGARELRVSAGDLDQVVPSPDGTGLAYVSVDKSSDELWLTDLHGRNGTLLARVDSDVPPVWSPDSQRLAFLSNGHIWIATAQNKEVRRLGPIADEIAGTFGWSPNSRDLAYAGPAGLVMYDRLRGRSRVVARESKVWECAWTPDGRALIYWGHDGIYTVDLTATRPRGRMLIASARDFALSPDGHTLAYDKHFSLYIAPLDRVTRRRLLSAESLEYAWSPDSRTLAFSRKDHQRSGTAGLYLAARAGGRPRSLVADLGSDGARYPSWAPEGRRLAYQRVERGYPRLYIIGVDGSDDHQVLAGDPEAVPFPGPAAWLPHGIALPASPQTVAVQPDAQGQADDWVRGVSVAPDLLLTTVDYPLDNLYDSFSALFWTPSTGRTAEVHAECDDGIAGVALALDRYAYLCETYDSDYVYELYVGQVGQPLPSTPVLTNNPGDAASVAGGGDLLVAAFGHDLDRIDTDGTVVLLRHYPAPVTVLAVDQDQILLATSKNSIDIVSADGTLVASLAVPNAEDVLLRSGRIFTLDGRGNLTERGLDGQPVVIRSLPGGSQLEDADPADGLVVYTLHSRQHLLRLADGRDVTLHLPGQYLSACANFSAGGIDYAYNAFGPVRHLVGYLTPTTVKALFG
jgi:Tol biopolymer transport system component